MDTTYYYLLLLLALSIYWTFKMFGFLSYMFKTYILTSFGFVQDLKKFGRWAVVTGATDGIGKCYAQELAKRGLNIVLVSRTKVKLLAIAEQIAKEYHVETKIIVFDFSYADGYESVATQLDSLDIAVVINNVGMSYDVRQFYDELSMEDIRKMMHTNLFGELYITRIVLPGMVRKGRGVVVHVSSCFSFYPSALLSIYPATKAFINSFWKGLQLESESLKDIHHQLVTPNFVCSNMTNSSPSLFVPTAEQYASSAVKTIGIADETCGYWSHEFIALMLKNFSHGFIERLFLRWVRCKRFEDRCYDVCKND